MILALLFTFLFNSKAETPADYIQKNAFEIHQLEVPQALLKSLENHRLFLIGENHGASEYPEYAGAIVEALAKKQKVALGIEYPRELQYVIDQFLMTGDESLFHANWFFQNPDFHSGRGSTAMVALLRQMRALQIPVFCFDVSKNDYNDTRDTGMAQNIVNYIAQHPDTLVVTYSGNRHSRLTNGTPWNKNDLNMGAETLRLSGGILTVHNTTNMNFAAQAGSIWNCMSDSNPPGVTCKERNFGPSGEPYASAVTYERFYLIEQALTEGHYSTLFIRNITASLPF